MPRIVSTRPIAHFKPETLSTTPNVKREDLKSVAKASMLNDLRASASSSTEPILIRKTNEKTTDFNPNNNVVNILVPLAKQHIPSAERSAICSYAVITSDCHHNAHEYATLSGSDLLAKGIFSIREEAYGVDYPIVSRANLRYCRLCLNDEKDLIKKSKPHGSLNFFGNPQTRQQYSHITIPKDVDQTLAIQEINGNTWVDISHSMFEKNDIGSVKDLILRKVMRKNYNTVISVPSPYNTITDDFGDFGAVMPIAMLTDYEPDNMILFSTVIDEDDDYDTQQEIEELIYQEDLQQASRAKPKRELTLPVKPIITPTVETPMTQDNIQASNISVLPPSPVPEVIHTPDCDDLINLSPAPTQALSISSVRSNSGKIVAEEDVENEGIPFSATDDVLSNPSDKSFTSDNRSSTPNFRQLIFEMTTADDFENNIEYFSVVYQIDVHVARYDHSLLSVNVVTPLTQSERQQIITHLGNDGYTVQDSYDVGLCINGELVSRWAMVIVDTRKVSGARSVDAMISSILEEDIPPEVYHTGLILEKAYVDMKQSQQMKPIILNFEREYACDNICRRDLKYLFTNGACKTWNGPFDSSYIKNTILQTLLVLKYASSVPASKIIISLNEIIIHQ